MEVVLQVKISSDTLVSYLCTLQHFNATERKISRIIACVL